MLDIKIPQHFSAKDFRTYQFALEGDKVPSELTPMCLNSVPKLEGFEELDESILNLNLECPR
jgi:hypothetical protein